MSNLYQGTPPVWVIDTASATPINTTDFYRIASIQWVPGANGAQGDECKVTDGSGDNVIFDKFATGADQDIPISVYPRFFSVTGITVPTLSHGKVWITFQ